MPETFTLAGTRATKLFAANAGAVRARRPVECHHPRPGIASARRRGRRRHADHQRSGIGGRIGRARAARSSRESAAAVRQRGMRRGRSAGSDGSFSARRPPSSPPISSRRRATAGSQPQRGGTLFLKDVTDLARVHAGADRARGRATAKCESTGSRCATIFRLDGERVARHRQRCAGPSLPRRSVSPLAALRIDLPPLRERAEDVPASSAPARRLRARRRAPRAVHTAGARVVGALTWPGNLAELQSSSSAPRRTPRKT